MGRIDVVVPDGLEVKLRVKAVASHGGRRGSLSEAVQTAIEAYVRMDEHASILESLTKTLRDPSARPEVVREAIGGLAEMGEDGLLALTALTDVARDPTCPHREIVDELLPAALRFSRMGRLLPDDASSPSLQRPEPPSPSPSFVSASGHHTTPVEASR